MPTTAIRLETATCRRHSRHNTPRCVCHIQRSPHQSHVSSSTRTRTICLTTAVRSCKHLARIIATSPHTRAPCSLHTIPRANPVVSPNLVTCIHHLCTRLLIPRLHRSRTTLHTTHADKIISQCILVQSPNSLTRPMREEPMRLRSKDHPSSEPLLTIAPPYNQCICFLWQTV
jgi:hypothetical protein